MDRCMAMKNMLEEIGKERLQKYADSFRRLSLTLEQLPVNTPETEKSDWENREEAVWYRQLLENREVLSKQYYETSQLFEQLENGIYNIEPASLREKKQILLALRSQGIYLDELWVRKENGKQILCLMVHCRRGACMMADAVARIVSDAIGRNYIPVNKDGRHVITRKSAVISMMPEPDYYMMTGVVRCKKNGEVICGDSFTCLEKEESKILLGLSDGMGSGWSASKESTIIIDLYEQLIDAGFDRITAIQLINQLLVLRVDEEKASSLDVCLIDLYTGNCEILKAGASTTFICREHLIEAISSTCIPVGMMQRIDEEHTMRQLKGGDCIVMVTDGVLDALPEEKTDVFQKMIRNCRCSHPQKMAKRLMRLVLDTCGGQTKDDMSIVVGMLWEK